MPDFRRGAAAVTEAQQKAKSGGSFRQFVPEIFWKGDGAERYLLFLNPMNDIPTVDMISFIPVQGKKGNGDKFTYYERVIARTDPAIGEDTDPMAKNWDGKPRATCVAVAVELEPTFEEVNGRKRPTGFEVAMTSFERRVRDDKGDLTDETEEVNAPVVGFVHASPHNFFNVVTSYDANEAPIESTPLKITRVGNDNSTTYTVTGYPDQVIDLAPLVDYIDGISYLGDDLDDLLDIVDGILDDEDVPEEQKDSAQAEAIGTFLLDKRLEELCDSERYDELYEGITESLDRFGGGGKKKADKSSRGGSRRERPTRRTQRRSRDAEPEESASAPTPEDNAQEPEAEEKPKPARQRRSRAAKETPAEEPQAEAAEEKPSARQAAGKDKLAELRARQAKRKAAA